LCFVVTRARDDASTMSDDPGARAEKRGGALTLTVDRPHALNALNARVIEFFHDALDSGERDASVAVYVIRGAGRAFCAGGDVRAVREMLLRGESARAIAFFTREFALNGRLARLCKPSCAVWNGVVMGGGAGLSCYADVRVATEHAVFAMPECAIGLYPDVGAGWFLNALCGHATATYLSLTGARVRGAACKTIGLATHYVRLETWERDVAARVEALPVGASASDLAACAGSDAAGTYLTSSRGREAVEEVFGNDSMSLNDIVVEIRRRIERATSEDERAFFVEAAASVVKSSPTSLEVSLELMRRARGKSLDWVLAIDNALIGKFILAEDFSRGVEAVLVSKTGVPPPGGWTPARPVADYFRDVPKEDAKL
jgi:enoyl-CoA hydratase